MGSRFTNDLLDSTLLVLAKAKMCFKTPKRNKLKINKKDLKAKRKEVRTMQVVQMVTKEASHNSKPKAKQSKISTSI